MANNYCSSCGIKIPPGQTLCSMCMGDTDYGSDGYYTEWLRRQEEREEQRYQEAYRRQAERED